VPKKAAVLPCRNFVAGLNTDRFISMYLPLATVAIGDFYKQLNDALKGEPCGAKSVLFKSIQERILHYTIQLNKIPVIIIDEAHLLKNENFFELQIRLSSFLLPRVTSTTVWHETFLSLLIRGSI